jgi:Tfp pilus assembly PilM family ATPase
MLGRRTTGWVGIDVGGACVKTAQAVRRGGKYFIRAAAIVPRRQRWTPELLSGGQPQSSVDEMLASAAICDRLSGRTAAAVLPMALCEALQVDAPASRRSGSGELAALVAAETHQSAEDRILGSWPARLQAGKINVISAPSAWSDQVSADVAAARWNCRAVDALPWALARAACLADAPRPLRTVAALDWAHGRATICLVHEGAPAIVRCLKDCGFASFVAAAQQALRVSPSDAELLLLKHGLSGVANESGGGESTAIDDALVEPLHRLERELRRTLGYWQSQTRGTRPERMYLFGAGASLRGIDRLLSKTLDLDVQRWHLPAEQAADADLLPPAHLLGPALAASALAWEDAWPTT